MAGVLALAPIRLSSCLLTNCFATFLDTQIRSFWLSLFIYFTFQCIRTHIHAQKHPSLKWFCHRFQECCGVAGGWLVAVTDELHNTGTTTDFLPPSFVTLLLVYFLSKDLSFCSFLGGIHLNTFCVSFCILLFLSHALLSTYVCEFARFLRFRDFFSSLFFLYSVLCSGQTEFYHPVVYAFVFLSVLDYFLVYTTVFSFSVELERGSGDRKVFGKGRT